MPIYAEIIPNHNLTSDGCRLLAVAILRLYKHNLNKIRQGQPGLLTWLDVPAANDLEYGDQPLPYYYREKNRYIDEAMDDQTADQFNQLILNQLSSDAEKRSVPFHLADTCDLLEVVTLLRSCIDPWLVEDILIDDASWDTWQDAD